MSEAKKYPAGVGAPAGARGKGIALQGGAFDSATFQAYHTSSRPICQEKVALATLLFEIKRLNAIARLLEWEMEDGEM